MTRNIWGVDEEPSIRLKEPDSMADYGGVVSYPYFTHQELYYSRDRTSFINFDPLGVSKKYYMRAYHTVLLQFVHWISQSNPDFTGSGSGYAPADLSDITVIRY